MFFLISPLEGVRETQRKRGNLPLSLVWRWRVPSSFGIPSPQSSYTHFLTHSDSLTSSPLAPLPAHYPSITALLSPHTRLNNKTPLRLHVLKLHLKPFKPWTSCFSESPRSYRTNQHSNEKLLIWRGNKKASLSAQTHVWIIFIWLLKEIKPPGQEMIQQDEIFNLNSASCLWFISSLLLWDIYAAL